MQTAWVILEKQTWALLASAEAEGGGQERASAERYRNWSQKLAFEHPYVASLVESLADTYDHEAAREDSEAAVRRRLRH